MSIKNFIKPLILVMFLTLRAKSEKKRGRRRVREARESGGKKKPPQHSQSKKKKRSAKTGVAFARRGAMLTSMYIYNIIYNII